MEIKTRKLMIALELLAIVTAAVLILIDYKLKQDLLKLFERIESAIETANGLHNQDAGLSADTGGIPGGSVVGDYPIMETPARDTSSPPASAGRKAANQRASANGSRGA